MGNSNSLRLQQVLGPEAGVSARLGCGSGCGCTAWLTAPCWLQLAQPVWRKGPGSLTAAARMATPPLSGRRGPHDM